MPLARAMPSDALWGDGSGCLPHATQDFACWIVEDVPTVARATTSCCDDRSPVCIAGLGMGGFTALRVIDVLRATAAPLPRLRFFAAAHPPVGRPITERD